MNDMIKDALTDEETRKLVIDVVREAVWGRLKIAAWATLAVSGVIVGGKLLVLDIKDDIVEARRRRNVRKGSIGKQENTDGE